MFFVQGRITSAGLNSLNTTYFFQSEAQSSISLEPYEMVSISEHHLGIQRSWGKSTAGVLIGLTPNKDCHLRGSGEWPC